MSNKEILIKIAKNLDSDLDYEFKPEADYEFKPESFVVDDYRTSRAIRAVLKGIGSGALAGLGIGALAHNKIKEAPKKFKLIGTLIGGVVGGKIANKASKFRTRKYDIEKIQGLIGKDSSADFARDSYLERKIHTEADNRATERYYDKLNADPEWGKKNPIYREKYHNTLYKKERAKILKKIEEGNYDHIFADKGDLIKVAKNLYVTIDPEKGSASEEEIIKNYREMRARNSALKGLGAGFLAGLGAGALTYVKGNVPEDVVPMGALVGGVLGRTAAKGVSKLRTRKYDAKKIKELVGRDKNVDRLKNFYEQLAVHADSQNKATQRYNDKITADPNWGGYAEDYYSLYNEERAKALKKLKDGGYNHVFMGNNRP